MNHRGKKRGHPYISAMFAAFVIIALAIAFTVLCEPKITRAEVDTLNLHLEDWRLSTPEALANCHIVGDVDFDGAVTIDDATFILDYVFNAGPAPDPPRFCSVRQIYKRELIVVYSVDTLTGDTVSATWYEPGHGLKYILCADSVNAE